MPSVSVGEYQLSYSHNGVAARTDELVLVLLHGTGGDERDWPQAWRSVNDMARLVGLIPKSHGGQLDSFPIFSLDLPGHGQSSGTSFRSTNSYADAVAGFLTAMQFQKVILVGHSMGAAIALTLSAVTDVVRTHYWQSPSGPSACIPCPAASFGKSNRCPIENRSRFK